MRRLAFLALVALASPARADSLLDDSTRTDPELPALVHRATTAALLGEVGGIDDAAAALRAIDEARRDRGLAKAGVTDDVELLAAACRPTRDARRDALHAVLDDHPDPIVERTARHALEQEDDAAAADRLLSDDRHNRRATVVNDAVRPLGVFSGAALLAVANPFLIAGSALDSLLTTAVNLYHYNELSPREREALVRYRRQLARDPNTTDAADIVDAAREINARHVATLCKDTVTLATKALADGDLDRARFYVDSAGRLPGCEDRVATTRERVAAALAAREARAEAARWPADDLELPSGDEHDDYAALVSATALGDPAGIMAAAQRFTQRHPDSDNSDGATLAVAVARDLAGHRGDAADALHAIARDKSGPGRVAAAMLESPRYHRLDALAAAERRHSRDVAQYVLVGGGVDGRTALYTAAQFGAQGMQAAESFGVFNVLGMVSRAWNAWRKDPASNQAIIDEGEQYLANEPEGVEASDVHERLATAYERAGAYDRALLHYRAVDAPDPKRIEKLEGKIADQLLENAHKAGEEPALLAAIVHYYPTSDAAEKAEKLLKDMPRTGTLPVARDVLVAHPSLLGPSALDLDPILLDGRTDNGELADAGVTVTPDALVLTLRNPDGGDDRTERRPLTSEKYDRARAAAEDALYAAALTTDPDAKEFGRFERYIPLFIAGSLGDGGVSVAPGIKLRRDTSPDRPLYE